MTPCRCGEPRTPEHRCWATREAEVKALWEVAEAAANVVAQWRGDISRKPMIGRLRHALAKLGEVRR